MCFQNISKDRLKGDLFEYLTNNVKFDLPETVVNKEFERLWEHKEKNITEENKEKAPIKKEDKQHKIIFTFQAPKTDLYGVYLKEKEELTITSQE